ncbi:1891_t:CDS:2, partial [Acaulospora colombiana]
SIERKLNAEANQAALYEARSKPGRSKAKSNTKDRTAWGRASPIGIVSPQPTHSNHQATVSELTRVTNQSGHDNRPGPSRRLPAIPGRSGPSGRSPDLRTPDQARSQDHHQHFQSYSRPSSLDPHSQARRPYETPDEFGYRGPAETSARPGPQAQTVPNRAMWSTMLDPKGEAPATTSAPRDTFVTLDANETMTKAFAPQGLLQAGMLDKQNRSAKQQEATARETGVSLVTVPGPPPPPQMGLVGAITAHQRDREREGGMGATLTQRERDKREAEDRQRKFDELQRAQLDRMSGNMDMQGYNPMMMNPMMGWGMPMMYGMGPMGMGGMGGMGWGGGIFSQAGSQAGSDHGDDSPNPRGGASSPVPGWGMPMGSPMMSPMMMPGMVPGMGMMPGMMP